MPTDTIVIGGGVVGICVALCLQRSGRRVTVLERTEPGNGASGHNAGSFSIGDCTPIAMPGVVRTVPRMLRDPLSPFAISWPYLPRISPWLLRFLWAARPSEVDRIAGAIAALMGAALPAYRTLIDGGEAEQWMRPGGLLYFFATDESFAKAQYGVRLRERWGQSFEIVDKAGVAEIEPALDTRFRHGIYLPDAHYTPDPRAFVQALANTFLNSGGRIDKAAATGFELAGNEVRAVHTTAGRRATGEVVLAAGAWSRQLARELGALVPLDTERGYGVHLPDAGFTLRGPIISGDYHLALAPEPAGVRAVGTVEFAGLRAPAKQERAQRLSLAVERLFPGLRSDKARWWMSYRPSMPDSLPVIGQTLRYGNAYLAFGHGHKGMAQAAITGQLVRQLADGEPTTLDVTPYRPDRFSLWPLTSRR